MNGKDPKDMAASELLRFTADECVSNCEPCVAVFGKDCGNHDCHDWMRFVSDKIDAELVKTHADGISKGISASLRAGAEIWAKANGWPDFKPGEDFGAWLDRCAYKKLVDDRNEPVQFGEEIELHFSGGGMEKGRFQEVKYNKGPVWILSFTGVDHAREYRYDSECDTIRRPAPEALGADGLPIVVGETAYDTKTGIEIVVSRIAKDEDDNVIVCASGDICELQFAPYDLTHASWTSGREAGMKKAIIAAALAVTLLLAGCSSAEASDGTSDRFEHTGNGINEIRVITDTETGVQYLFVADSWNVYAGMGGLTVLVDADGRPLVAGEADHD